MKGHDFLATMAASSRERVRVARAAENEQQLLLRAASTPQPPALKLDGFDIIAELKLHSPAAGQLQDRSFDRAAQIAAYAQAGACAVSVLTEPDAFHGDLSHLTAAAQALAPSQIPAMRKDFLTDPYQVLEARAAGAGGVLVIVTMLDDATVGELLQCAEEQGLFVLLEGFDKADLARIQTLASARRTQPLLAGVNCRDLTNLNVDFQRFESISDALPGDLPTVAESGISTPEDIRVIVRLGYRLALIGSALMTAGNPQHTLAEFLRTGRNAVNSA